MSKQIVFIKLIRLCLPAQQRFTVTLLGLVFSKFKTFRFQSNLNSSMTHSSDALAPSSGEHFNLDDRLLL